MNVLRNKKMLLILKFLFFVVFVYALPKDCNRSEKECGYYACRKLSRTHLNIHIVPHSHDDVGWLKTVDQYYYGGRSKIQHAGVQFILDSAIQALLLNPERRFVYVETAFFWKWWQRQNKTTQDQVKCLVNNGQLEIIGGAWTMNDEAATHYQSTIDQFTWGFRKLNETLGACAIPKIGWQIDPFGHSREQASIFSQLGFDGLFFARLDYRDKEQRLCTKTAELIWQGSQSLGPSSQIFTSILYNHYMTPPGFCFDIMCPDDPIVNDEESPEYNAEEKAIEFLNFAKNQSIFYKTNNVIITMGGDFHYQDSLSYFTNMDRLMKAMNKVDPYTNVFYSTPTCYLKAVHDAHLSWTVKTDDFFPYASDAHSYWTGYYTSRPTSKRFERLSNNVLQVAKQLSSLAFSNNFCKTKNLNPLREAIGVMQHHDAITGTEKQHVADDYHKILHLALEKSFKLVGNALQNILGDYSMKFETCIKLNISDCVTTEKTDNFLVTVYNPLSRPVNHYVRIPVSNNDYVVFNSSGIEIDSQMIPIFDLIQNIPGRQSIAENELIFKAENIPALGFRFYFVKKDCKSSKKLQHKLKNILSDTEPKKAQTKSDLSVHQDFYYYEPAVGNNIAAENRSSGAYIFRPCDQEPTRISIENPIRVYKGSLVEETHTKYNSWLGIKTTNYLDNPNFVELTWFVGPIPVDDERSVGKEIISRFKINYKNNKKASCIKEFYTDSNGREMIKRVRGQRSSYNLTFEEPVSQNYYPITSKISVRNKNFQVSVLTDRAQGGGSITDNTFEIMIHRRLLKDDSFGVEEPLNESAFGFGLAAVGKHYLVSHVKNSLPNQETFEKQMAQEILLAPWMFFTPLTLENIEHFEATGLCKLEVSALKNPLPNNLHILTLEPWDQNIILLRLEHIMEKDGDPECVVPVTVNLLNMFSAFDVKYAKEMSLGANILKSEVCRLKWDADILISPEEKPNNELNDKMEITLYPMDIKTFLLYI